METLWKNRLQKLESDHLAREMRITGVGPIVKTDTGEKLIFCANDYLGMATSEIVAEAARDEICHGLGAGASRLVSGNFPWHEKLEQQFADFVLKPASVLFPSGYQANVGAISGLTTSHDVIFSDRLCHASIIDGCRLSKATVEIFDHNNVDHLSQLLDRYQNHAGGKLVITEGIFSMDGDMPPLMEICNAARAQGAAVYLDEAHSLGIIGPEGRGLAASLGISEKIDILVGTFGKAIGVSGACVAGGKNATRLIKSAARSLMYTTAAPPALSRAVCESLSIIKKADDKRQQLDHNIRLFKELAHAAGILLIDSSTPIQPVLTGNAQKTMAVSKTLWDRGIFVQGIRPPTVPVGTERLRITISAVHSADQIKRLVEELSACGLSGDTI